MCYVYSVCRQEGVSSTVNPMSVMRATPPRRLFTRHSRRHSLSCSTVYKSSRGSGSSALRLQRSLILAAVNYDLQQAIPSLDSISGPGSFALLDNLALGLPPNVPHPGDPGLTVTESSTHFAIWCK